MMEKTNQKIKKQIHVPKKMEREFAQGKVSDEVQFFMDQLEQYTNGSERSLQNIAGLSKVLLVMKTILSDNRFHEEVSKLEVRVDITLHKLLKNREIDDRFLPDDSDWEKYGRKSTKFTDFLNVLSFCKSYGCSRIRIDVGSKWMEDMMRFVQSVDVGKAVANIILREVDEVVWKDPKGELPTDFIENCLLADQTEGSEDITYVSLAKGLIPRGQVREVLRMAVEEEKYQKIPYLLAYLDPAKEL